MSRWTITLLGLLWCLAAAHADEQDFTVWEDGLEVFAEHPPLVVGETARLLVHLTLLDGQRPVREGRLTLTLTAPDGTRQQVSADAPAREGIYLPELAPARAGEHELLLELAQPERRHRVAVPVVVYASADAVPAAEEEAEGIAFFKEQQWRMAFATESARREPIAPRLSAPAVVEAAAGRRAELSAPARGTLRAAPGQAWPQPGRRVQAGDALVQIAPLAGAEDVARLQSDAEGARARARLAESEHQRVQGLVREGVIPQRRLQEAEAELATARSALRAAEQRLEAVRGERGGEPLVLRAPLDGVVVASPLAPGQVVEAGAAVATVLDTRRVWLRVQLLAQDLPALSDPQDLRVRRPGSGAWEAPAEARLVYRAAALDAGGILPLVFEVDNRDGWPVGLPLIASLAAGEPVAQVSVPAAAVLDDDGVDVVIVQRGGEDFERRPVRLGGRAAGRVAVLAGLAEGERVVTAGAYAVLLAGRDPSALDHGHAH
ncbi:efflux RND transporter periplasmic adaptor subunit [Ectothiorhodospiraceae bacterium 2226]|nr:efflux RND transporter periplasmic adaptor subunit [Ectothiorhodospiraceae bacterium 2226]